MNNATGQPETGAGEAARIADKAEEVLNRAERRSSLSGPELQQLRSALKQARPGPLAPDAPDQEKIDPEALRRFVTITSGAASAAALGAVSGTVLGTMVGSLLFPGLATIAGAVIGSVVAAVHDDRSGKT